MEYDCKVRFISWADPVTGKALFETKIDGHTEFVACTLPDIRPGATLHVEGSFKNWTKRGRTFVASKAYEVFHGAQAMENLLSSGLIRGIGPAYARRIISRFGDRTFDIMDNEIDRLVEIPGIGPAAIGRIRESWARHRSSGELMVYLQKMGVDGPVALRILEKYGPHTKEILEDDPYRLTEIWNVPFALADNIATSQGILPDDERRVRSGIMAVLNTSTENGNVYLPFEDLKAKTAKLLSVDGSRIRDCVVGMLRENRIVNDGTGIYLPKYLLAEKRVAENLKRLDCIPPPMVFTPELLDKSLGIVLDAAQSGAVEKMVSNPVSVLTGGPGTGKTTIIKGMIRILEDNGMDVALTAPTGRAAKRMTELTGRKAYTLHRLLRWRPGKGFTKNAQSRFAFDAIIIDECSMVDLLLMDSFLEAVKEGTRLVFVGDCDQLPSVGAGNVLSDLINCNCFPVTKLETIHRQASESLIVSNSFAVNHGKPLEKNKGDFWFIESSSEDIPATVLSLVKDRLPGYLKVRSKEIQVLCPTRRMTDEMNTLLQQSINAGSPAGSRFRIGDKVMQIVNDYGKKVFNGDMGIVEWYDEESGGLGVDFDGMEVEYNASETDELNLAYAVTVHKSQGSEYRVVVICMDKSDRSMLKRNLLYTAMTRAKEMLVIVGSWEAVETCVSDNRTVQRNSSGGQRISDALVASD